MGQIITLRRSLAHWFAIPILATATLFAGAVAFVPASRGEVVGTAGALAVFLLFAWLLAALAGSGAALTRDALKVTVAFRTKRYDLSRLAEAGTTANQANPRMNHYALLWFVGDRRPVALYLSASRKADAQRALEALGQIAHVNAAQGLRRETVARLATGPSYWVPAVLLVVLGLAQVSLRILEGAWAMASFLGAFFGFFLVWFVLNRCNARFGSGQFSWQDWRGRWRMKPLDAISEVTWHRRAPSEILVQCKDGTKVHLTILGWVPSKTADAFMSDLRKAAGLDTSPPIMPAKGGDAIGTPTTIAN